jgi:hypothetical protein
VSASSPKLAKRLIEPDVWTCPHGARQRPRKVLTYGPEVADVNAAADFAPDPQQQLGLDLIFAINPDGTPASFEFCVICCRQNLKTGLFKQTAVGWVAVLDEPDVVWSAHEMSTTLDAQAELHEMFESAASLSRWLPNQKNRGLYTDNGSERIELVNPETGQSHTIWFKARRENSGRGLARGKLILDEAFALKARMLGSLLPLMLTKPHGQVLYGSSAGKADSDALFDIRDRGRKHLSPRLTYLEWGGGPLPACEDPDCTTRRRGSQAGRPVRGQPHRGHREAEPDADHGPDHDPDPRQPPAGAVGRRVVPRVPGPVGRARGGRRAAGDRPAALVDPLQVGRRRRGGPRSCSTSSRTGRPPRSVSSATGPPGGRSPWSTSPGPGRRDHRADRAEAERRGARGRAAPVRPGRHAGTGAQEGRGIKFTELVHKDMGRGCSAFQNTVERGGIVHVGQSELDTAVGNARIRVVNEIQLWDRKATRCRSGRSSRSRWRCSGGSS